MAWYLLCRVMYPRLLTIYWVRLEVGKYRIRYFVVGLIIIWNLFSRILLYKLETEEQELSQMDKAREKSKIASVKKIAIVSISIVFLLVGIISIANIDFQSRRIDRDTVLIGTVELGDLEIRISANGELLPREIEQVSVQAEGRVAKVYVSPGDEVYSGQLLAELSNPQLLNAAEESFSAWEGAVADLRSFEVELENQLLNQESTSLQVEFSYEKALLELEAKKTLHERNIIPEIEFLQTELDVEQLRQTIDIEKKRLQQSKDNMATLLAVRESRVTQLERAMDRANNKVASLQIVAGIDGIVQELDLELGQQLTLGSPVGRLARQDLLYAELRVPARQASDVSIGQNVLIDTRNGLVNGLVDRIDPGVTEGTVIIDVDIHDPLPRGARPQLQVEGNIYVAQIENALHMGRPTFIRTNSAVTIYKLDGSEEYAERVNIRMGRASVTRVEILEGLAVGDQVILSDSSAWQDHQRVLLN